LSFPKIGRSKTAVEKSDREEKGRKERGGARNNLKSTALLVKSPRGRILKRFEADLLYSRVLLSSALARSVYYIARAGFTAIHNHAKYIFLLSIHLSLSSTQLQPSHITLSDHLVRTWIPILRHFKKSNDSLKKGPHRAESDLWTRRHIMLHTFPALPP